jgi:hypothetical protein
MFPGGSKQEQRTYEMRITCHSHRNTSTARITIAKEFLGVGAMAVEGVPVVSCI